MRRGKNIDSLSDANAETGAVQWLKQMFSNQADPLSNFDRHIAGSRGTTE